MRTHGVPSEDRPRRQVRGEARVALSPIQDGRFGRMFRRLSPAPALDPATLSALAEQMREAAAATGRWSALEQEDLDNPTIPAAYTYLGQFLDHDITFDPVSSLDRQNDPDALVNFRTPRLDLDSVYGSGPDDEPFQYDQSAPGKLLVEPNRNGERDLPRTSQRIALIGDPRNDENTIVSQLQLAFLLGHNKLVDQTGNFRDAQQLLRWHYQWVIVNDFLPRIVGRNTFDQVARRRPDGTIDPKRRYYKPRNQAYMPIEFSVAAYRYGHSQVRGIYDLNTTVTERPIFIAGDNVGELDDLRGRRPLPREWTIDWSRFVSIADSQPQLSRKIDTQLAAGLFDLPGIATGQPQSLAERNLLRSERLGLPSGQAVAQFMGITPLDSATLGAPEPTPLWFYILRESELAGGQHLGPVGGRIVAEVILGLIEMDPQSYLSLAPAWTPTIPAQAGDPTKFELADLLQFAAPFPA